MHVLIVKHGALGDVVRTSYFAAALRGRHGSALRLSWITAPMSVPLIRFNPHVDDVWTSFPEARGSAFDLVYSLDDELPVLEGVRALDAKRVVGAWLDDAGERRYTADSSAWFDMGLLSRFGKAEADRLKALNRRSHAEIFAEMFEVPVPAPSFFGNPRLDAWAREWVDDRRPCVGVNPFAGGRWPSKELRPDELRRLVRALLDDSTLLGAESDVVLVGAGPDRDRNLALAAELRDPRVRVADTDDSILRLSAIVRHLRHLVTSDSLAMHLAIAQRVPVTAFFAPTSAAEIDTFGLGSKVVSTSPDYCSYRKDADNSSITAARILSAMKDRCGAAA